jgi:hypothetical protein
VQEIERSLILKCVFIMTKKEFKANLAYLENAGVVVSEDAAWINCPFSRELYFETPSGGDFGITVEEVTREKVLEYLDDYDVNEECILWWNSGKSPFSNIKALYEDIEQWLEDFKEIAYNMPY